MGRILDENDDDSRCIIAQLSKARSRWWRMAKTLKREGADPFQMGRFYIAVVQAVLLYGAELWTISLRELEALERDQMRKNIPFEKLMIETDCPYLIPKNLDERPKNNRNEPSNLNHIASEIAMLMEINENALRKKTYENTINFFDN